jgi:hypothetical protein
MLLIDYFIGPTHNVNRLFKQLLIILSFVFIFSNKTIFAQSTEYYDSFNLDNFDLFWDINNYASGNNGSYASNSELNVFKNFQSVSIYGTGIHDTLFEEDRNTGWFGKSIILKDSINVANPVKINVDYRLNAKNAENFSVLTIEFNKDNRIMYTFGNFIDNNVSHAALQFEEFNNTVRCVNCSSRFTINVVENHYHQLSLSFNPDTKIATIYFDGIDIDNNQYLGELNDSARVGFGTAVRLPGSYVDTTFDNFSLTSNTINSNSLNLPDIKQYSSPWGLMEYNSATNWYSSDPTITRWGCALTSASMVLQYHGHDVFPDTLNSWLLNQPDGYIGNGYLNWLAVSRYSLQNQSPSSSPLEFRLFNEPNDPHLKQDINNDQPVIVRVPGHFVTVKG